MLRYDTAGALYDPAEVLDASAAVRCESANALNQVTAREIAEQYVATLTGDMRAVHDARYVRGLPQRAAADQIRMSRSKLRKLEDRMHDQLRALLAQAGIRDSNVTELLEDTARG